MIKNNLYNISVFCVENKIPIISNNTSNFLVNFLKKFKPKNCLEVWWAVWYSSLIIWNTIWEYWWNLTSFEINFHRYRFSTRYIDKNNIKFYNFDFSKIKIQNLVNKKFDFVFIDWMKRQYLDYLLKLYWTDLISKNCIFILDDVIKYKDKMINLYSYLKKKQIFYKIEMLDDDDWIMVIHLN